MRLTYIRPSQDPSALFLHIWHKPSLNEAVILQGTAALRFPSLKPDLKMWKVRLLSRNKYHLNEKKKSYWPTTNKKI
jgi:hypothetical protein